MRLVSDGSGGGGMTFLTLLSLGLFLFWGTLVFSLKNYEPTLRTYLMSFWEFLTTYIFGNVPLIWLALSISMKKDGNLSIFIEAEGRPGQVLVYISAFLAPVVWSFVSNFKNSTSFWHFTHFVLILLCLLGGIFLFSEYGNQNFYDNPKIDRLALSLYFISLSLWFFSIVYGRALQEKNFSRGGDARDNKLLVKLREKEY